MLTDDETTVTKTGKSTHGLGRFFSSIHGRAVKGLNSLSLWRFPFERITKSNLSLFIQKFC